MVTSLTHQWDLVEQLGKAFALGTSSRLRYGTNIFERDWDLLIVLDACRTDVLREFRSSYPILADFETIWSVGSATREWAANTFTAAHRDEIADTAIVAGNATVEHVLNAGGTGIESEFVDRFTDWSVVDSSAVGTIDSVWDYGMNDPYGGTTLPSVVTDRAVSICRAGNFERYIVHYIPPHIPYRAKALIENRSLDDHERDPWTFLRSNDSDEPVRSAYQRELDWVLEHVEVLLNNVDAQKVVITADHGELFGELGLYAHPAGVPHPNLRRVPWVETTANDSGIYTPKLSGERNVSPRSNAREQLENLGYI